MQGRGVQNTQAARSLSGARVGIFLLQLATLWDPGSSETGQYRRLHVWDLGVGEHSSDKQVVSLCPLTYMQLQIN